MNLAGVLVRSKDSTGGRCGGAASAGGLTCVICPFGASRVGGTFGAITCTFAYAVKESKDGLAVGVGERRDCIERMGPGGGWLSLVRLALDPSLFGTESGFGAFPPLKETAEALLGCAGSCKQRGLLRTEYVTERLKPALFDVLAAAGGEVEEHGKDVVMEVVQAGEDCGTAPRQVVEVREFFQETRHLGGAGRGPAFGPGGAVLPELKDGGAGVGGAGVSIGGGGVTGLVGCLEECGGVVGEPSGEGVVGVEGIEFGKDALTKRGHRVSWQ